MDTITIRPIQKEDNASLAMIIRNALKEFGADKPGTVYYDESTDHLFELFQQQKAAYHVVAEGKTILGGAGIYPTDGLPEETCELVKMYLSPAARGKGLAKLLMQQCLLTARKKKFKKVYIETMPELVTAVGMYEKSGFTYLQKPLGNSGHNGCSIWLLKAL
jgi:putative acetyltransferase